MRAVGVIEEARLSSDPTSVSSGIGGTLENNDKFSGTLDEPVKETIMRDLSSIWNKLYYVLLPKFLLAAGDLWGPLILCLTLSIILWAQAFSDQKKLVFALVFVIVWFGAAIVTANAVLLGGEVFFFQTVCVLGYCLFPLDIAALCCFFIPAHVAFIKIILLLLALHWSTGASVAFMSEMVPLDRRLLAVYPVWLFYVVIAWIILVI